MRDRRRKNASSSPSAPNAPGPIDLIIVGRNAIREVLRHSPHTLKSVWGSDEALKELEPDLRRARITAQRANGETLSSWAHTDSHQGILGLLREERSTLDLPSLINSLESHPTATVLLLDSIYDPQNLGTLLRAAECFGVDAVIWSRNRGAPLSPVARKASVGASELVPLVLVPNLAEAVEKLKQSSFWVVALDGGEGGALLGSFTFPERCVVVAGSEGRGVQPLLLKKADFRVKIPLHGKIDSLNVSQATSIALYELQLQRTAVRRAE
ncbi:MAG: 23S rRNA (guanosine(2251)-2'-O)-methyltransferase RlmB [Bdellovibrionota bacterium]|nr:MAG: 23S rRNA (guanosine(2251)-2'-O)-methyltransferase RlmB [Bdellovibrionota bacterium]